jgi:hypothetical protein
LVLNVWIGLLAFCVKHPWTVYEGRSETYTVLTVVIDVFLLTIAYHPLRILVDWCFLSRAADGYVEIFADEFGSCCAELILHYWSWLDPQVEGIRIVHPPTTL